MADPAGWSAFRTDSAGVEDCKSVHEAETGYETKKIRRGVGVGRVGDHPRGVDLCRACIGARESALETCKDFRMVQDWVIRQTSSSASWIFGLRYEIIWKLLSLTRLTREPSPGNHGILWHFWL